MAFCCSVLLCVCVVLLLCCCCVLFRCFWLERKYERHTEVLEFASVLVVRVCQSFSVCCCVVCGVQMKDMTKLLDKILHVPPAREFWAIVSKTIGLMYGLKPTRNSRITKYSR